MDEPTTEAPGAPGLPPRPSGPSPRPSGPSPRTSGRAARPAGSAAAVAGPLAALLAVALLAIPGPAPAQEVDRNASLRATVVAAEDGEPLEDAFVRIREDSVTLRTDDEGTVFVRGLSPGRKTLEVRYLGRSSASREIALFNGRLTSVELSLEVDAVEVPGIEVTAEKVYRAKMAGFYERMEQSGSGSFVTRRELAEFDGRRLHSVFRSLVGVRVVRCSGRRLNCYRVVSTRAASLSGSCSPTFFLDGAPVPINSMSLGIDELNPENLEAIEVYSGPASIPPQFTGNRSQRCGVVVLWTRQPGL